MSAKMRWIPFGLAGVMMASVQGILSQTPLVSDGAADPGSKGVNAIRVRSVDAELELDSLWRDSVWTWEGPCEKGSREFRFEFGDTLFRLHAVPCSPGEMASSAAPSGAVPNSSISVGAMAQEAVMPTSSSSPPLFGQCTLALSLLLAQPGIPLAGACYPPARAEEVARLLRAVESAIFESEKCALVRDAGRSTCLLPRQAKQLLFLIPSEDLRMQTMNSVFNQAGFWSKADIEDLFQLQFMRQRALATFETR